MAPVLRGSVVPALLLRHLQRQDVLSPAEPSSAPFFPFNLAQHEQVTTLWHCMILQQMATLRHRRHAKFLYATHPRTELPSKHNREHATHLRVVLRGGADRLRCLAHRVERARHQVREPSRGAAAAVAPPHDLVAAGGIRGHRGQHAEGRDGRGGHLARAGPHPELEQRRVLRGISRHEQQAADLQT
jgi:hypothetical protein